MRVAVVGAGVSGLAAVKCCLDGGLDVICFERRNDIGGLWNYTEAVLPGQSNVTRSTVTNTSKETTCFSDFPMPADFPNYLHHSKYLEYLRIYAQHFNLVQHIQFATEVVQVEQLNDGGRWSVTTKRTEGLGDSVTEIFNALMVCVGIHSVSNMPDFEGRDQFSGELIHSINYRHPDSYRGKRVVIVGVGNTACDAAVDLSSVCSQVYLSVRNGAWFVRRVWDNGLPLDLALFNRFVSSLVHLLPSRVVCALFRKEANSRFDHALYGLRPNNLIRASSAVTNDDLPSRILSGSVQVRASIARLTSSRVELTDGTYVDDVDAVICATGYSFHFPFLQHDELRELSADQVNLYKYTFAPGLRRQTLAIIGCVEPMGPHPPLVEMQARVAVAVFKGDIQLQDSETMWGDVWRTQAMHEARFVPSARRYLLVDYIPTMDELGRMIGCTPPNFFRLLLTDPRLAVAVYCGLTTPYQYRLVGPGAWTGARDAVLTARQRILQPLNTRHVPRPACRNGRLGLSLPALVVSAIVVLVLYFCCTVWN